MAPCTQEPGFTGILESEFQDSSFEELSKYLEEKRKLYNAFLRVTDLLGPWRSGRALQVLVHTIQQPEQELQGVMLGIASELRAVLGNCILKEKKENQRVSLGLSTTKSGSIGSRSISSRFSALLWDNTETIQGEKWSFL